MKRSVSTVDIGDDVNKQKRHRVLIEDVASGPDKGSIQTRILPFLQQLIDQPALMYCGLSMPEKFMVFHNGTNWVFQAEAVDLT